MIKIAQILFKNEYVASIFADALRILGVSRVVISRRVVKKYLSPSRKSSIEMLNTIVNNMLLGKIRICREEAYGTPIGFYKNILLLYDVKKHTEAEFRLTDVREECPTEITGEAISLFLSIYPRTPVVLLDATLWDLHHEEERKKAVKQFMILINTLRKRLTELNVILVSPPIELVDLIKKMDSIIEINDGSIYTSVDPSKVVLLDPYAHEELSVQDVLENQYFIIGLLVDDKFPRPYATYMLKLLHGIDCKRRAIKLYKSVIGVPKEINKIIDILLDIRLNGLSLENAIISNMSIDDKIRKVVHDIRKHALEGKIVDEQYVRKLCMVYDVNEVQFEKICKRIKRIRRLSVTAR